MMARGMTRFVPCMAITEQTGEAGAGSPQLQLG